VGKLPLSKSEKALGSRMVVPASGVDKLLALSRVNKWLLALVKYAGFFNG
jgi:hypothetical protein